MIKIIPSAHAAIQNLAVPGGNDPTTGPTQFAKYVAVLWRTIIIVGGLAFLIFLIWGGIEWITAGGEKGKVQEARERITQGLVGLAILAASFVIVEFISRAIGIDLLLINWPTAE